MRCYPLQFSQDGLSPRYEKRAREPRQNPCSSLFVDIARKRLSLFQPDHSRKALQVLFIMFPFIWQEVCDSCFQVPEKKGLRCIANQQVYRLSQRKMSSLVSASNSARIAVKAGILGYAVLGPVSLCLMSKSSVSMFVVCKKSTDGG